MTQPAFNPGFRFSVFDAVVLIAGGGVTVAFVRIAPWIGLAIAFVVVHFFLFCNVFRISRSLELSWAAVFALLATLAATGFLAWPIAFSASIITTVVVIVIEARRPSYHGVAWKTINPKLSDWWRDRFSMPSN